MSRLVPKGLAETLLARISQDAERVDWDHLPQASKTEQLARWVEDPAIGGVLQPLVGGEAETRMWLKEVALKRRARAQQPSPAAVVDQLFPGAADVIEGSVGTKPHHALVRDENGLLHYVCWGPYANAKHLFWAGLNACEDEQELEVAWIVIVDTIASRTPTDRRARLTSLAARCGLKIDWMGS